MARPPRGRLPGSDRSSEETGDGELPFELPRVDPIRPRSKRMPRVEPVMSAEPEKIVAEKGPPRFVPPLRAAMPEPNLPPRRIEPEKLDNPFDYYAMPSDDSDPLSRAIVKPSSTPAYESPTSKYYKPRADLSATRDPDQPRDQTETWARSVRPGRPIPDLPSTRDDDTPPHLRHLPSRVRDHLRAEPKMPVASETLGSFTQSAPTTTQLRARSGVPLPLAPELRAPVPQDVRVTRQIPDVLSRAMDDDAPFDRNEFNREEFDRDETADVVSSQEPEFDSASDEAVTDYRADLPPLVSDLLIADRNDFDDDVDDDIEDDRQVPALYAEPQRPQSYETQSQPPSWMRRDEQVAPPPPVAVSDWDQDEALHALTSRIRNRAVETAGRMNTSPTDVLIKKARGAWSAMRDKARDIQAARAQAKLEARNESEPKARGIFSTMREKAIVKARDIQTARAYAKVEARMETSAKAQSEAELWAARAMEQDIQAPLVAAPMLAPDLSIADESDFRAPRERRTFFKFKPRAPRVRVSPEANRAQRRKRQSRLYEDIVAWIVVPPFIIGAIYGGLELAKFLSNSPLGKMLSGQ